MGISLNIRKILFKLRLVRHWNRLLSCGCLIIGSVQGQVGLGFVQTGLMEGVPVYCREVGLDGL